MTGMLLGLAAAAVGCVEAVILAGLDVALLRNVRRRRREQAIAAIAPEIRTVLVDFLAGAEKSEQLRSFLERDREALTEGMLSFGGTVAGGARDRLCELALDLGLVRDWCGEARTGSLADRRVAYAHLAFVSAYEPCRRITGDLLMAALEDSDSEIRISAARGLIQSGETDTLERVFDFALSSNPLTRAVLAEDLRRYAAQLCEVALPTALSSRDIRDVLAALDIMLAWQRAVIVREFEHLLEHPDPEVRLRALRLAPVVAMTPEARAAVIHALEHENPAIAEAAALAAGRLRIEESLPYLAALACGAGGEVARSAVSAIAGMLPQGRSALEAVSAGANAVTAAAARTALGPLRGEARA